MSRYYDLSASSSEEEESDSDNDDLCRNSLKSATNVCRNNVEASSNHSKGSLQNVVLHLDVDCFYCQCEELEHQQRNRPLAIQQKHIVVTCNYVAREYGVQKLQLVEDAKRLCPSLWIVQGSDLERYRRYSRKIYDCFRSTCYSLSNNKGIAVAKGCMDEMQADLTMAASLTEDSQDVGSNRAGRNAVSMDDIYIYGDTKHSGDSVVLTEDQSGATTTVRQDPAVAQRSATMDADFQAAERQDCIERLQRAARLALHIQESIHRKTGFTTSLGISVNPFLAKLASSLRKPSSVNLLYPWHSASLILPMPLRKIPDLGSRTYKVLSKCIQQHQPTKTPSFWTCGDLLQTPRRSIEKALVSLKPNQEAREEYCDLLLQRCRGLDSAQVIDDEGGLPKTVSVENSFRRGTICSRQSLWPELTALTMRLPRLLRDRQSWSPTPERSFPTTIRLTVRLVQSHPPPPVQRRPFVTHSNQCRLDGSSLMQATNDQQPLLFQRAALPLLNALLPEDDGFDLTRLNLAVTNFQDSSPTTPARPGKALRHADQLTLPLHFSQSTAPRTSKPSPKPKTKSSPAKPAYNSKPELFCGGRHPLLQDIDPSVLAELPADIVEEIKRSQQRRTSPAKRRRIDHFFPRKGS